MASQDARLSKFEADFKQQQNEIANKIYTVLKAITDRITGALPSNMVKNPKLNINSTSSVLSTHSYLTEDPQCSTRIHSSINAITKYPKYPSEFQNNKPEEEEQEEKENPETSIPTYPHHMIYQFHSSPKNDVMFIEIIKKNDDSCKDEPEAGKDEKAGELEVEYFDIFLTRSELAYHKKLDPRVDPNRGVSNFMGRIKGMHVFVGNFTYVIDFMIVEDISLIIDPRLSHVVLGKPFIEMSNMSHDPSEGNGTNEVAYKMPHKIEQCDSLSDLEKNIQNLSTLGTRRIKEEE
ncbi:hypothetical protein Tco_0921925 [Tanacetum coccineum]|uniref:MAK10-like protein n=1 Tax=Tanacetum coccineum TaxID=301880 RepID=A0ABQ5CWN3_9ASTR